VAYPSGSGSEILRRGAIHNQVTTATSFKFDGTSPSTGTSSYVVPTNHIITILNISFHDQSNTEGKIFWIWAELGGIECKFNQNVRLGAYETYVWNEKIVLHSADKLLVNCNASSNVDIFYTYVDQNWE
jgi:hypothetical protein